MPPRLISDKVLELFPQHGRSKGRHVSEAIHAIMRDLYPDRFDGSPIDITRANFGNAFEHAMIEGLMARDPDRFARPGQLEHEGVYGTPDLWDIKDWAAIEFKLTWASARRAEDIEDVWWWRYWVQLKAYCYMAGQSKGRLYIGFVNGDYSRGDGGGPRVMGWEDEWGFDELEENWLMLMSRLKDKQP